MIRLDPRNSSHSYYRSQAWIIGRIRAAFIALMLLSFVTVVGTAGYCIIEGWTVGDAFYMTMITLSTVGFGEIHPLSPGGRLFTSFLIMSGVCIAAYTFTVIGQTVLEGELHHFRRIHRMYKRIASLKDHVIICGYGRLALSIIPDLNDQGYDTVVIENDPSAISRLEEDARLFVEGNAYDDAVLQEAGIERAMALLAILPHDADNVFITLSARNLNKRIRILARTEIDQGESKLRLAGANQIIAPYRVSGSRIVQQLTHPYVNDFLEVATDNAGTRLVLEQVVVPESSHVAGQTLETSELRSKTGVIIAACIGRTGSMTLNPGRETVIESGSTLIALGTQEGLDKLGALLS